MKIMNQPLLVREMRRGSPRIPKEYAVHAYREFTPATRRMVLRWYRAMDPETLVGWDTRLLAVTAQTPKRVLWGDLDPFIPASTADRFGGEVTHLTDCGHWPMLEEPERVAAAIAELVGKHP
jgi:haloalkane dehalogenase